MSMPVLSAALYTTRCTAAFYMLKCREASAPIVPRTLPELIRRAGCVQRFWTAFYRVQREPLPEIDFNV